VFILSPDEDSAKRARAAIEAIVKDIEVGNVYLGKVVRIVNFGAFVELAPGKDGLVHISKLSSGHVDRVEDVVKVGDEILVRVTDIDKQGRVNLTRKGLLPEDNKKPEDNKNKGDKPGPGGKKGDREKGKHYHRK
jgi:polyribonucleotide nucleotidyltransferase